MTLIDPNFLSRSQRQPKAVRTGYWAKWPTSVHSGNREMRALHERQLLMAGWENQCAYCTCKLTHETVTVDHVIPLALGGSERLENLVPACRTCNIEKGSRTAQEFLKAKGVCVHRLADWEEAHSQSRMLQELFLNGQSSKLSDGQRSRLGII